MRRTRVIFCVAMCLALAGSSPTVKNANGDLVVTAEPPGSVVFEGSDTITTSGSIHSQIASLQEAAAAAYVAAVDGSTRASALQAKLGLFDGAAASAEGTGAQGCAQCHAAAICVSLGSLSSCSCRTGYRGNGTLCDPVDVCADQTTICASSEICMYAGPGEHFCVCPLHTKRNGSECVPTLTALPTVTRAKVIDSQTKDITEIMRAGALFGSALAFIGDIDGDGIEDLASGASGAGRPSSNDGLVMILFRKANGRVKSYSVILKGDLDVATETGSSFGSSIAGLGDIDQDGVPDIAVGAPTDFTFNGGFVVILMTREGGVKASTRITATGLAFFGFYGGAIAQLGDVDGDGTVDVAVGAHFSSRGTIQVMFLNDDGQLKSQSSAVIAHGSATANFGKSVAALGLFDDGDTVPDMAVGAYQDSNGGSVFIVFLNADGSEKAATQIGSGLGGFPPNVIQEGDGFGIAVATGGDVNGDGVPDLYVAAYGTDSAVLGVDVGVVYVLQMLRTGNVQAQVMLTGVKREMGPGSFLGHGLAVANVTGNDPYNVAVSVFDWPSDVSGGSSGAFLVLSVDRATSQVVDEWAVADNTGGIVREIEDHELLGDAIDGTTDIDFDGTFDLVVGTSRGASTFGAIGAFLMEDDGTIKRERWLQGPFTNERFGAAIAVLRTNSTEFSHARLVCAVGAPAANKIYEVTIGYDLTMDSTGEIGLNFTSLENGSGVAMERNHEGDEFGASVAVHSDVNGDGLSDLLVGAPGRSDGGPQRGALYFLLSSPGSALYVPIVLSSTLGNMSTPLWDFARFGHSVAVIGDVNGDGTDDIAVGAYNGGRWSSTERWQSNTPEHVSAIVLVMVQAATSGMGVRVVAERVLSAVEGGLSVVLPMVLSVPVGASVQRIGDFDQDGTPDLLCGFPESSVDETGTAVQSGSVYVVLLDSDGSARAAVQLNGTLPLANETSTSTARAWYRVGRAVSPYGVDGVVATTAADGAGLSRGGFVTVTVSRVV